MTTKSNSTNEVRRLRTILELTQAELAIRAGISRTAVTAIEGDQLVPSVQAALSLAKALGTTVEVLFGRAVKPPESEVWAANPKELTSPCWQAEVSGRLVLYPATSSPMLALLPDRNAGGAISTASSQANETLVMAGCDPAAGLLSSLFTSTTGLRLIMLPRSSRQSVEMLRRGLVHLAGLHLSTRDEPERNIEFIHDTLGAGFQTVRLACWQEGIVLSPTTKIRSVNSVMKSKLKWIGREPGSGARQCLDRILGNRVSPRCIARDHHGVVEAVRSGWADVGICVQLVSDEAGLCFLPVQQEAFDVCFPTALADDRRIKAFLSVIRSTAYRKLLGDLPGYDTSETGSVLMEQS
jgi:molybdate-binding protein/DNA-binding XRE family transcriptional regulator